MASNKVMLDTCVFNAIADSPELLKLFSDSSNQIDYIITTIQTDEIASTPDSKMERRKMLLIVLADLRARIIPTSVTVLGAARLGRCRLGEGQVYKVILSHKGPGSKDAIIADTSVSEGALLLTNDAPLIKAMHAEGYEAQRLDDFIKTLNVGDDDVK